MRSYRSQLILALIVLIAALYSCSTDRDEFAISKDGVPIHYAVKGKGEPTLVFVHGWSNNMSVWDDQVTHFSEKHKVVTIDLAGFGKSGSDRSIWSMASYGEDVAAVINKLNLGQVVLIGFSMGSPVIIETANKVPEHIIGLVLVDFMQNIEAKYSDQSISKMDSIYMDIVTAPTIENCKRLFKNKSEALSKKYISSVENVPKIGWSESFKTIFRWLNEDCITSVKNIQVPVIAINSDRIKTNSKAFIKYVPSFKAKIIPGVGHFVMWEAPEKFNQLLEESIVEFTN